jgi:hypothetical protein
MKEHTVFADRSGGGYDVWYDGCDGRVFKHVYNRDDVLRFAKKYLEGYSYRIVWVNPSKVYIEQEDLSDALTGGIVIQDDGSGYAAFLNGKVYAESSSWNGILKEVVTRMLRGNYYPDIFYVNERGNVDLLRVFRRGKGYSSKILQSWV